MDNKTTQSFYYPWIKVSPTGITMLLFTAVSYATMPIGIMGSNFAWLRFKVINFSNKEGERTNTRVCAVSFHHAETSWDSIKQS